jgi:VWFA-related protein
MRITAACALLVAVVCATAQAQPPAPAQPVFRAGVSLVEVAAVAVDDQGRTLDDLTAADFEVLEDGQERPLVSVRKLVAGQRTTRASLDVAAAHVETLATNVGVADAPAFVLVLDDLNTSPFDAHRVIRAGLGLLGAIPSDALVAVVTTSGEGGSLLTLTRPGSEHAARVREFRGRVILSGPKDRAIIQTRKSAVDAPCGVGSGTLHSQDCADPTRAARRAGVIDAVAQMLGRAGSRRKVVFWVTEDMGVSPLDPHGNQAAQRAMLQRVLNADVAVYPVNPREGEADMRGSAAIQEGDRGPNRPDRRTGGLVRIGPGDRVFDAGAGTTIELNTDDMVAVTLGQIARESGGRWITNANDLDKVLADVVVQNSTSYVLAFEAASAQTPGRHRIDVRVVGRDNVRVFARRGYVVPEVPAAPVNATDAGAANELARLLRETAFGTVPQGQLGLTAHVTPEFAVGRTGRALVTVQVDAATAGDSPVELVVLGVDNEGKVGEPQAFRMSRPEEGPHWELTTPLALDRGTHQVRVAAVTADGARTGLVIVPVEIIEPGNALIMAPPVVLTGAPDAAPSPTLARTLDAGLPIGVQVDVAGRPVRDQAVSVIASLQDAQGRTVRDVDAVLDPGARADQVRATAVMSTADLAPGEYALVIEARGPDAARRVRHAVPVTLRTTAPSPATAVTSSAATRVAPLPVAHGPSTLHRAGEPFVIRDEATWQAFWGRLPTTQRPPDIDFTRVTLLAFVVDAQPASPVQPLVERIDRDGHGLVVRWRTAPATTTPATDPGFPYRPFAVLGIIGHDGPVRFEAIP